MLNLSIEAAVRLENAVADKRPVRGATHQFYRYPARFSPQFARAFIEEFTEPGDLVVDPFVGGGTTLVEAMLLGRRAVGSDINSLAAFISQVKTSPLATGESETLQVWFSKTWDKLRINRKVKRNENWGCLGYFKNIDSPETWRYQKLLQIAIDETESLPNERCSNFARCVILHTAQLALDGRKTIPPVSEFRKNLKKNFKAMLDALNDIRPVGNCASFDNSVCVINSSAAQIHEQDVFKSMGAPRLILTSPPYPGVHVLYHRWQVRGRRETPAPYWIANKLDGDGERYYTLGNRYERELKGYFENLEKAFHSISKLADEKTTIIQMVAFSEPEWQLPKYLEVLNRCNLMETDIHGNWGTAVDRLWRDVPNRKWHAEIQTKKSASREVVLVHRKKR